ncbi:MAG: PEPxxWA-CTERM sorting domain-containing protein [Caulobacteraceae bacterium]|nr:PEPxxWA-CTERM sorting domain-containing protein [Caulobacteraceae bacterium]
MKIWGYIVGAVFGLVAAAGSAQATTTYDLGPVAPGTTYTSNTINVGSGTTTEDFTFSIASSYVDFSTAGIIEGAPFKITDADLSLYTSSNVFVGSTGSFNPLTQPTPTLTALLGPGDYYIAATVTVPSGFEGAFSVQTTVAAAPEPAAWALMIMGVGLAGAALRLSRRSCALAGAAA